MRACEREQSSALKRENRIEKQEYWVPFMIQVCESNVTFKIVRDNHGNM